MIKVEYRGREGRRVNGRYEIRFLVTTSDGKEFWSHKNGKEAERHAQEYLASIKQAEIDSL
jgi:hypothetical protein